MKKSFKVAALVAALVSAPMMAEANPWDWVTWEANSLTDSPVSKAVEGAMIGFDLAGEARVYILLMQTESCAKAISDPIYVPVDGRRVRFIVYCQNEGALRYMSPESVAGRAYLANQFKRSKTVNITGETEVSATGFTKAWNEAVKEAQLRKTAL